MTSPEVVTFGEALGLFLAADGRPLARARTFERQVAGAELNVAVGLARLGHTVGWFGRIGEDSAGQVVLDTLHAEGVDTSRVTTDASRATGLLVRDRHAERRVRVDYHRSGSAASALTVADVDEAYVTGARLVHATGITAALSVTALAATRAAMSAARAAGITTSLDPNVRLKLWDAATARRALTDLSGLADVILTSVDEASLLTGLEDRAATVAWFRDRGARVIVLKDGANGAWGCDQHGDALAAAPPVAVVDPVGAGDAFDAGFMSGWLRGEDLERCLVFGAAAGAACVQVPGDLDGLPTRPELDGRLMLEMEVDR